MAVIVALLPIAVAAITIDQTAVRVSDTRSQNQKSKKPQAPKE
jgi:hypothetical protein